MPIIKRLHSNENSDKTEKFSGLLARVDIAARINTTTEFEYIKEFVQNQDFDYQVVRNQLRALWTAYCIHAHYEVDTASYDSRIYGLWDIVSNDNKTNTDWHDFDTFDGFMCADMV